MKRVLLDEGVPWQLATWLEAPSITIDPFPTVWKGLRNGTLLRRAQDGGYDVLLTNDKNFVNQQNLRSVSLAILALATNRLSELRDQIAPIEAALRDIGPGQHVTLLRDGTRRLDFPTDRSAD